MSGTVSIVRHWRELAGVTAREAAACCGLHLSSYYQFERDALRGGSDQFGLRLALARLFTARLGYPVSAQWDLCGPIPDTRDTVAAAPQPPLVTGGQAGPRRASAVATVSTHPHHGDTDPPGRSGTAGRIAIAGRGETFPHLPSLPVPVALAGDPHAAEAAPRLPSAGTPRPIRAARGAAHTTQEAG